MTKTNYSFKFSKRLLSLILAFLMFSSVLPLSMIADEIKAYAATVGSGQVDIANTNNFKLASSLIYGRTGKNKQHILAYDKAAAGRYDSYTEDKCNMLTKYVVDNSTTVGNETHCTTSNGKAVPIYRLSRSNGYTDWDNGVAMSSGGLVSINDSATLKSNAKEAGVTLSDAQADMITKVLYYGLVEYKGKVSTDDWYKENCYAMATQAIIWEIEEGKRTGWGNNTAYRSAKDGKEYYNNSKNAKPDRTGISGSYGIKNYYWHDWYYTNYHEYFSFSPDYYDYILKACENHDGSTTFSTLNSAEAYTNNANTFSSDSGSACQYTATPFWNSSLSKWQFSFSFTLTNASIGSSVGQYSMNELIVEQYDGSNWINVTSIVPKSSSGNMVTIVVDQPSAHNSYYRIKWKPNVYSKGHYNDAGLVIGNNKKRAYVNCGALTSAPYRYLKFNTHSCAVNYFCNCCSGWLTGEWVPIGGTPVCIPAGHNHDSAEFVNITGTNGGTYANTTELAGCVISSDTNFYYNYNYTPTLTYVCTHCGETFWTEKITGGTDINLITREQLNSHFGDYGIEFTENGQEGRIRPSACYYDLGQTSYVGEFGDLFTMPNTDTTIYVGTYKSYNGHANIFCRYCGACLETPTFKNTTGTATLSSREAVYNHFATHSKDDMMSKGYASVSPDDKFYQKNILFNEIDKTYSNEVAPQSFSFSCLNPNDYYVGYETIPVCTYTVKCKLCGETLQQEKVAKNSDITVIDKETIIDHFNNSQEHKNLLVSRELTSFEPSLNYLVGTISSVQGNAPGSKFTVTKDTTEYVDYEAYATVNFICNSNDNEDNAIFGSDCHCDKTLISSKVVKVDSKVTPPNPHSHDFEKTVTDSNGNTTKYSYSFEKWQYETKDASGNLYLADAPLSALKKEIKITKNTDFYAKYGTKDLTIYGKKELKVVYVDYDQFVNNGYSTSVTDTSIIGMCTTPNVYYNDSVDLREYFKESYNTVLHGEYKFNDKYVIYNSSNFISAEENIDEVISMVERDESNNIIFGKDITNCKITDDTYVYVFYEKVNKEPVVKLFLFGEEEYLKDQDTNNPVSIDWEVCNNTENSDCYNGNFNITNNNIIDNEEKAIFRMIKNEHCRTLPKEVGDEYNLYEIDYSEFEKLYNNDKDNFEFPANINLVIQDKNELCDYIASPLNPNVVNYGEDVVLFAFALKSDPSVFFQLNATHLDNDKTTHSLEGVEIGVLTNRERLEYIAEQISKANWSSAEKDKTISYIKNCIRKEKSNDEANSPIDYAVVSSNSEGVTDSVVVPEINFKNYVYNKSADTLVVYWIVTESGDIDLRTMTSIEQNPYINFDFKYYSDGSYKQLDFKDQTSINDFYSPIETVENDDKDRRYVEEWAGDEYFATNVLYQALGVTEGTSIDSHKYRVDCQVKFEDPVPNTLTINLHFDKEKFTDEFTEKGNNSVKDKGIEFTAENLKYPEGERKIKEESISPDGNEYIVTVERELLDVEKGNTLIVGASDIVFKDSNDSDTIYTSSVEKVVYTGKDITVDLYVNVNSEVVTVDFINKSSESLASLGLSNAKQFNGLQTQNIEKHGQAAVQYYSGSFGKINDTTATYSTTQNYNNLVPFSDNYTMINKTESEYSEYQDYILNNKLTNVYTEITYYTALDLSDYFDDKMLNTDEFNDLGIKSEKELLDYYADHKLFTSKLVNALNNGLKIDDKDYVKDNLEKIVNLCAYKSLVKGVKYSSKNYKEFLNTYEDKSTYFVIDELAQMGCPFGRNANAHYEADGINLDKLSLYKDVSVLNYYNKKCTQCGKSFESNEPKCTYVACLDKQLNPNYMTSATEYSENVYVKGNNAFNKETYYSSYNYVKVVIKDLPTISYDSNGATVNDPNDKFVYQYNEGVITTYFKDYIDNIYQTHDSAFLPTYTKILYDDFEKSYNVPEDNYNDAREYQWLGWSNVPFIKNDKTGNFFNDQELEHYYLYVTSTQHKGEIKDYEEFDRNDIPLAQIENCSSNKRGDINNLISFLDTYAHKDAVGKYTFYAAWDGTPDCQATRRTYYLNTDPNVPDTFADLLDQTARFKDSTYTDGKADYFGYDNVFVGDDSNPDATKITTSIANFDAMVKGNYDKITDSEVKDFLLNYATEHNIGYEFVKGTVLDKETGKNIIYTSIDEYMDKIKSVTVDDIPDCGYLTCTYDIKYWDSTQIKQLEKAITFVIENAKPSDHYVRFISQKYFEDENGNLVDPSVGGLSLDSKWRNNEEYRLELRNTLAIKRVDGVWSTTPDYSFEISNEEKDKLKEEIEKYTDTNGIASYYSKEWLNEIYNNYVQPNLK